MKKILVALLLITSILNAGDMTLLSLAKENLIALAEEKNLHGISTALESADNIPKLSRYAISVLRKYSNAPSSNLLDKTQMQIYEALKPELLMPFSAKESKKMENGLDALFYFKSENRYPLRWLILHFMLRWQTADRSSSPCSTKFFFKGLVADTIEAQAEFENIPEKDLLMLKTLFQKNVTSLNLLRHFSLKNFRLAAFPIFMCSLAVAIHFFRKDLVQMLGNTLHSALVSDGGDNALATVAGNELREFRVGMNRLLTEETRTFRANTEGQLATVAANANLRITDLTTNISRDVGAAANRWRDTGAHIETVVNNGDTSVRKNLAESLIKTNDALGRIEGLIGSGEELINDARSGSLSGWVFPKRENGQKDNRWFRLFRSPLPPDNDDEHREEEEEEG